jgi:hypothetical protein
MSKRDALRAAIVEAMQPFVGLPLTPENTQAIREALLASVVAFEATQPADDQLSAVQINDIVERGIATMLRIVALDMARGATSPGGDA